MNIMIPATARFGANILVELIKLKRSFAWWLTVMSAALLPTLYFIAYFRHATNFVPGPGSNPWTHFFNYEWTTLSFILLPLYIVLVTSLIMQSEYKSRGWKHLLTQPTPKIAIYLSKLLIVVITVGACYLLFLIFSLLAGLILGSIFPALKFLSSRPDYTLIIYIASKSFISTLGIIAIQFYFSLKWKNFIIPLGLGISGVIIAGTLLHHWKYQDYFPYAEPILSLFNLPRSITSFALPANEWASILYFILFTVIGYFDFKWKKEY